MNEREQTLVQYALLLGLYGEDAPQTHDFEKQHANDASLFVPMTAVVMLYRLEKEKK